MEFFNEFKVREIIFFPGSIRISKQNSSGTNLLGVQRGFCSAFPRHSIGPACVWKSGILLIQIRGWMPQLRALGSSFPFLPDNTHFGAVAYKREKINVVHSKHFPTPAKLPRDFCRQRCSVSSGYKEQFLFTGSVPGIPTQVTKVPLQWDWGQHRTKAQRTLPWFQSLCEPNHPSEDVRKVGMDRVQAAVTQPSAPQNSSWESSSKPLRESDNCSWHHQAQEHPNCWPRANQRSIPVSVDMDSVCRVILNISNNFIEGVNEHSWETFPSLEML